MTKTEAARLVDTMRNLWPSKFYWTTELTKLWVETLAKDYYNLDQADAVIRQHRRETKEKQPDFRAVTAKLAEVHRVQKQAVQKAEHGITAEHWAEVNRDRDSAAAWWHDAQAAGDGAEVVRLATLAYPMWHARWSRFLDAKFTPTPRDCLTLKCAWQAFHDFGPWQPTTREPGVMAGVTV